MEPWAEEAIAKLEARRAEIETAIAAIRAVAGFVPVATPQAAPARPTAAPGSDVDEDVLTALQHGKTTTTELAKTSRLSAYVVGKALKRLLAAKRIRQEGSGRATSYHPL